ncbi:MAG: C25 family cysteine peptidase, partial [Chitinispirillaceae bacterium]|nr:C25 family cysteine peptidase [Chitinispirillaceae bacterium]
MCDRISGAALCLFVVILAFSSLASATFTLSSLFESSVTADFAISRASNDGETFAFSTQPGAAWNADAAIIGNGRPVSLPVKRLSAGWYGSHYLQWLSFNPPAGSSGTIRITFATPVYKGVIAGNVEIKNAMLLVPLPQGVKKKPGKTAAFNRLIPLPFSVGLRIEVSSDDIHELTYGMLAEAKVPVASIAAKSYRLFVGSREVPVLITANPNQPLKTGDRILFYGESLRGTTSRYTAYSFSNIYWLTWSDSVAGQRVAMVSGERRIDDTHFSTDTALVHAREFYDTLHIEEDNDIRWLGDVDAPAEMTSTVSNNDDVDSWYWGFVGSSELTTFPVTIHPAAKTGIARLRIGFMGLTSVESDHADHQVSVLINGNPAGSNNLAVWDGQNPHVFTSDTFPVSRILKDRNEISFLVRKRDGEDMSALNWVEIEYPRIYRAEKDVLVFKSSSNSAGRNTHFELNGFTKREIDLWDIRKNRFFTGFEIRAGSGNDRQLFTLMFQDSIPLTTTYRAQLSSSYVSPSKPWLDTIRTDWKNLAGVDYVAISTGELGAALRPLLDMHEKRGLRTAFISLKDIYNSFSGGVTDPESIRSFVCMLFDLSPDHPPKYLLLAGDCTHDLYKKNRDRTIVPTHLSRVPGWGIASNDDYFGTVQDNDPFADLCVGRLPANNAGQLEIMVDKTVNYITKPERSFWRDNLLLASGAESE